MKTIPLLSFLINTLKTASQSSCFLSLLYCALMLHSNNMTGDCSDGFIDYHHTKMLVLPILVSVGL